jgi:hypothetical protein
MKRIILLLLSAVLLFSCSDDEDLSVPVRGLVAYYPFDGDAKDASGNGNDGELHGSAFVDGKRGQGIYFNNANNSSYFVEGDYVSLPAITYGDFTVALWVKSYQANNYDLHPAAIFSIGYEPANYFEIICDNSDTQDIYINTNAVIGEKANIGDHAWHYIVATKANGIAALYLDGKLVDNLETNDDGFPDQPAYFSYHRWYEGTAGSSRFYGLMDEARIYNRALSDREIRALYNE